MLRYHLFPVVLVFLFLNQCTRDFEPNYDGFSDASISEQIALEDELLAMHNPDTYREHLYNLTTDPSFAGTPENRYIIDYIYNIMDSAGLDTRTYDYDVLLAQPGENSIRLITPEVIDLRNKERVYNEDPYTSHPDLLHGWNAFSGSGSVTAEVVYANRGTKEDFERLEELGVSVDGKIVIARYGGNFRGYKAKYAEAAGASGLILYIDPPSNSENTYPDGIRPDKTAIQRGSLLTLDYYGDPLTPFEPALPIDHPDTPDRLDPDSVAFHTIPVAPIGYGAADEILSRMQGDDAPEEWQGNFDYSYRLTGGPDLTVELTVDQPYETRRISNVVGVIEGAEYPDEWIILGAHLDAWSFGATDPNSGTAMLLTLAESLGQMAAEGKRPKRSIMIGHWDAEEYLLIGSTEWVEHLQEELMANSVLYLNADMSVTGPNFRASSSPSLKKPIMQAAKSVPHPDTDGSLYDYWADRTSSGTPSMGNLGGGSDHVGFYMHAGIPSAGISISGSVPIYHTNFDTFWFYETYLDSTFTYGPALADAYGLLALRFGNADILPYDLESYTVDLTGHIDDINERAGRNLFDGTGIMEQIEEMSAQIALLRSLLDEAVNSGEQNESDLRNINRKLIQLERNFLHSEGLPFSPWLRSLYASSDPYSGYASWMLPAYRYAIEEEKLDDEQFMDQLHAAHLAAFERFSGSLDSIINDLE